MSTSKSSTGVDRALMPAPAHRLGKVADAADGEDVWLFLPNSRQHRIASSEHYVAIVARKTHTVLPRDVKVATNKGSH